MRHGAMYAYGATKLLGVVKQYGNVELARVFGDGVTFHPFRETAIHHQGRSFLKVHDGVPLLGGHRTEIAFRLDGQSLDNGRCFIDEGHSGGVFVHPALERLVGCRQRPLTVL